MGESHTSSSRVSVYQAAEVMGVTVDALEDGILDGEPYVIFLPVTVHGGANTTKSGGYYHVPKRDLVHAGIVAYQNGTLKVGKLRHRGVLEEELKNYRLKQNLATGYASFEPLRDGQHDDLLFATCLGVWAWERAIEKQEYISFPGEWELEGVPVNVVGYRRYLVTSLTALDGPLRAFAGGPNGLPFGAWENARVTTTLVGGLAG